MAKAQKTSDDFNGMLMASDLQQFHKTIPARAVIKYKNRVLREDGRYRHFEHQTIYKNPTAKPRLWREFWGILGKKINSTTRGIFQLDKVSLKFEFLILLKCSFNTFLSNELSFQEIIQTKKTANSCNLAQS